MFEKFYRSAHPLSLEKSLIVQIEAHKKKSPIGKITVLVPNHYVGTHIQHELALKHAHLNVMFETFEGFATRLLSSHIDFLKKQRLTPEIELFWIGKIAEQHLKDTELENISGKNGFHKNLRSFFHHLISNQTSTIPKINAKTKLFDLVFSKYLKLNDHYHHGLWNTQLASKSELKIDGPVFVYGFYEFSKLEQNFLTNIAKYSNLQLWMEIFISEKFQETTFTWLDQAFQNVEDLETIDTTSITTIQPCNHFEDEATWIAQTILGFFGGKDSEVHGSKRSHEIEGCPPIKSLHRIGIFLNDYTSQEPYIHKALTDNGIPCVPIRGNPLTKTRFGQSIVSILNLLLTNWNRAEWFHFLQIFPFNESIYQENGTPTDWSHASVQANVSSRESFFIERLVHYATNNPKLDLITFIEFQKNLLKAFTAMEHAIKQNNFKDLIHFINRFFQQYADHKELTPAVLLFLDELDYVCSKITKASWSDIQTLISEKLESTFFTEKKFESDGVLIAPIEMMKSLFFDVIFLPQLNEGKFPQYNERPFDLHPDEMKLISSKSPIRFTQGSDHFNEQFSWFDSAKDHCTQSLFISYSMYSLPKEDDLKPSIFLFGQRWNPIFVPKKSTNFTAPSSMHAKIQKWIESNQSLTWNEYNAYLDSKFVTKDTYSSSQLSKYATCPKQYFFSSVLGLSVEDYLETMFQMMPKDKGKIVHDILFRFFTELKHNKWIPLQKEKREQMHKLLAEITHEICSHAKKFGSYGITNLWIIDEKEIVANLMEYLDREIQEGSYWIPYSFELRFGMKKFENQEDDDHSTEMPLKLNLFQKELRFKGKVDRIDISADQTHMRITDYKTGNLNERKSWGYEKGTQLQIPLYILLADQFFPNHTLQEVNGKLVSIQAISKFDERNVTRTEILTKQEEIFAHIEMINEGITSGNFFPNPGSNGENCTYCDFSGICGSNIAQLTEEMEETAFMSQYQESKKALP